MENRSSVRALNVSKIYQLYDKPIDRLKESLSLAHKVYHKKHYALDNISFEVNKGETVGIIGTNGSGKSTLLKILTRVIVPTEGTIETNGKISALLELGAGFNPEYTGLENIYLNGTMMGYSRAEMSGKVENILNFADIGEFIHQPVKTYSSGMFARLAFAVAINVEPDILIVDEALSVGDIFFQNKCFRKFEELKAKGVTILFVSHDIESVKQMCSRVLWIEQGKQMMFGDKLQVCNSYARSLLVKNNQLMEDQGGEKERYKVGKFDLATYPPLVYSKESLKDPNVEIISCFMEDTTGQIEYDLEGGLYYRLVIIFKTKIRMEKCIAGFVLQNKKGMAIINSNTLITGQKRNFIAKAHTTNRVEFLMQFPKLMTDEYILDCAVADGDTVMNNTMHTWAYGALRLMVRNPGEGLAILDVDAKVNIYEKE